jgi:hypothetical protein
MMPSLVMNRSLPELRWIVWLLLLCCSSCEWSNWNVWHEKWDDHDGDGFDSLVAGGTDCDDSDPAINPEAEEVCDNKDNDCNGEIDGEGAIGVMAWFEDKDNDGFGLSETTVYACVAPAGHASASGDCDDENPLRYPDAEEHCDGTWSDCEHPNEIPSNEIDNDGDKYVECDFGSVIWQGDPSVVGDGDCDGTNPEIYPGQIEQCTGYDDNCNNTVDEGFETDDYYLDYDRDSYGDDNYPLTTCFRIGVSDNNGDCNDNDATAFPGAPEYCDNVDHNCNSIARDDDAVDATEWFVDSDGDTYGDIDTPKWSCDQPTGYVGDNTDCNDGIWQVRPGAVEVCDGHDTNCDGTGPAEDADNDGYVSCSSFVDYTNDEIVGDGDCNDVLPAINPGATEQCDGYDTDCSGKTPKSEADDDGDGYLICDDFVDIDANDLFFGGGDCQGTLADINPGVPTESCDGLDSNCDGVVDEDEDGDGYAACEIWEFIDYGSSYTIIEPGDCNDQLNGVNPEATEICDGYDTDCDSSTVLSDDLDHDGDGFTICSDFIDQSVTDNLFDGDDCDDEVAAINPDATEVCDGYDTDCNGTKDTDEYDDDGDGYVECPDIDFVDLGLQYIGGGDCADTMIGVNPGNEKEVCDGYESDCDSFTPMDKDEFDHDGDGYLECDADSFVDQSPLDSIFGGDDCQPYLDAVHPNAPEEVCDGYDTDCDGDASTTYVPGVGEGEDADVDGDGFVGCSDFTDYAFDMIIGDGDCEDALPEVNPSATEVCDGYDTDCDVSTVVGLEIDGDGDLYVQCDNFVDHNSWDLFVGGGDACGDWAKWINPGKMEVCDGYDTNCDQTTPLDEIDIDGDGYLTCSSFVDQDTSDTFFGDNDCDDALATINPGMTEVCDGYDTDCNPANDSSDDQDDDVDGYVGCDDGEIGFIDADPADTIIGDNDCEDGLNTVNPGESEACDGYDTNCDGLDHTDEGGDDRDDDNDGFVGCSYFIDLDGSDSILDGGDCDDNAPWRHPSNTEVCDGWDNDCNAVSGYVDGDENESDSDGDQYLSCSVFFERDGGDSFVGGADCDDDESAINPGASETCDGYDTDCNPANDSSDDQDNDGDGYVGCDDGEIGFIDADPTDSIIGDNDCDDDDSTSYPGATEYCDPIDHNCNGIVDDNAEGVTVDWYPDVDNDGYGDINGVAEPACEQPTNKVADNSDCVDSNLNIHPGATEVYYDDVDQDCQGSDYDADGDGYDRDSIDHPGTDCNDDDFMFNPLALELFDGVDNNCDGVVDRVYLWNADVMFTGEFSGDEAGYAVSRAGDINDDGYGDLLIGAPKNQSITGAAYVILGSEFRPLAVVDLGNSTARLEGETEGDFAGMVSAAGDVDGDGYDDILVGAPDAGDSSNGAAYLIRGSRSGIPSMNLAAHSDDLVTFDDNTNGDLGRALSDMGDINGDGFDDVAIGDPNDSAIADNGGSCHTFLGSSTGLADPANPATFPATADNQRVGHAVSGAGDIDGDGLDDAICGMPGLNGDDTGAVLVLFGTVAGFSDQAFAVWVGENPGDQAGSSASGADIDGDGLSDIIVGAPGHDNRGAAYIAMGCAFQDTGQTCIWSELGLLADADTRLEGESSGDQAGSQVSGAGDINGDGYEDILVSAPGVEDNAGATYLLLGTAAGVVQGDLASADAVFFGKATDDFSGFAISAAGDFDGDGYDDLLIGAYKADKEVLADNAGAAYLIFGADLGSGN